MNVWCSLDYTGIDNLEVMEEAVNYNIYLISLIVSEWRLPDKIMEFGGGTGTFALPIMQCGADIICIEQDKSLCEQMQKAGLRVSQNLDEIAPKSIDFIYIFKVLEHVRDDIAQFFTPS